MRCKLSDVASYVSTKIKTDNISIDKYISTENMLPDKGGVTIANSLPSTTKTNSFQSGDVLFSNIRTYFRKVWFATFDGGVSNDVLVLRSLDEDILFDKYLYYLLSNEAFIQYTVTTAKGTKMPRGDKTAIMNYEFDLPPLPTQKKIAHILSTLDDKIELNRQMNRTLEAMAQALFKSWFVDFDPVHAKMQAKTEADLDTAAQELGISRDILDLFPDTLVESEMGLVPEGWEVKPLSEQITIKGGGTPKRSIKEYWDGDILWFSVKDTPNDSDIFVIDTQEKITTKGLEKSSAKLLEEGSTIITARGTVGNLALTTVPMAMNQSCYAIKGKNTGDFYIYFLMQSIVNDLKRKTHGAVFDTITTKTFNTIDIVKPNVKVATYFDKTLDPIMEQIKNNLYEIQTLQKTRDALLPKLLSGELDVSEINL